jgi:hypothetical protein
MKDSKKNIDPGDGLVPPGPLSGGISTMKVAVRPPDIPAMEKISDLLVRMNRRGFNFPGGTSLFIRSIDGFIQFRDMSGSNISENSLLRVIEFDPSRGTFIVSGENEADITTEMAWYSLKALEEVNVLLFFPTSGEQAGMPEDVPRENRIKRMLTLARSLKESESLDLFGYRILKSRTLEEMESILVEIIEKDQSRSQ